MTAAPDGWTRVDNDDRAGTAPKVGELVFVREDFYADGATIGYFDGHRWLTWNGSDDCSVSWWAPIVYPPDPGPEPESA